jgi:hypothetical protein
MQMWKGIEDGLSYLCSHRREAGLYGACWGTAGVNKQTQICTQDYQRSIAKAPFQYCSLTDAMLRCVSNAVMAECGRDSAKFFSVYMHKMTQPAAGNLGCTLETPLSETVKELQKISRKQNRLIFQ